MTASLHQAQKNLHSRWITDLNVEGLVIIKLLGETRRIPLEAELGKKKKASKLDYIELSYLQKEGSCSQYNVLTGRLSVSGKKYHHLDQVGDQN